MGMRCFYVLIHGRLNWKVAPTSDDVCQPRGFFCHRYVLAADEQTASEIAFRRVRSNLDRQGRWLSGGSADLELEVEEICAAPFHKLLRPDDRGHAFYDED